MKKKSRRREFEKNNRVINIEQAQEERRARLLLQKQQQEGKNTARKARKRKVNYIRLIVSVAIVFLVVNFGVSVIRILKLENERDKSQAYNEELIRQKEELTYKLENVSLPEYIENQAREDLKLIKPSELLFIFPEDKLENKNKKNKED